MTWTPKVWRSETNPLGPPAAGPATPLSGSALTAEFQAAHDYVDEHVGVSVLSQGASGDGVTDDTAAFTAASTAAGSNGAIFCPAGPAGKTYILNNFQFQAEGQRLVSSGWNATLKAKAGALYVVGIVGKRWCSLSNVQIDGTAGASKGLYIAAGATSTQATSVHRVWMQNCSIGCHIDNAGVTQADKNTFVDCYWQGCATGLQINSTNAQETVLINPSILLTQAGAVGIYMTAATLNVIGGQCQGAVGGGSIGLKMSGGNLAWVSIQGWIDEGPDVSIDGSGGWPSHGMLLDQCILQGASGCIKMGPATSGTAGAKLIARQCRFNGNRTITNTTAAAAEGVVVLEQCRRTGLFDNPLFAGPAMLTPGEDPRAVGGTSQPAFNADFANYGSGNQPLQFWMDKSGMVHVHGTVKSTAGQVASTPIFALPVGYRPQTFNGATGSVFHGATVARLTIEQTTGNVYSSSSYAAGGDVHVSGSFWPGFIEALT